MGEPRSLAPDEVDDLLRVAHAALLLAHSPYSGLQVGAALLCEDGSVHAGCNVENASFSLTLCAERVAAVKAISAGARSFRAMALASSQPHPMLPCGACRQFLHEFAPRLRFFVQGSAGPRLDARLDELLPRAFGPRDVERGERGESGGPHGERR
jgi:cytidine deaminase